MTVEKAVNLLEKAKNVEEWNDIRDEIKFQVSGNDWLEKYVPIIDCSGLVVKVLNNN